MNKYILVIGGASRGGRIVLVDRLDLKSDVLIERFLKKKEGTRN